MKRKMEEKQIAGRDERKYSRWKIMTMKVKRDDKNT